MTAGDAIAPLFGPVDWERLLLPTTPLLETVIRGSFVYLALFALLRFPRPPFSSATDGS